MKSVIWLHKNNSSNIEHQTNKVAGYDLFLGLLQVSMDNQVFILNRTLLHTRILLLKILNFEVDVFAIVKGKVLPF